MVGKWRENKLRGNQAQLECFDSDSSRDRERVVAAKALFVFFFSGGKVSVARGRRSERAVLLSKEQQAG
jgi:hypothetical protein